LPLFKSSTALALAAAEPAVGDCRRITARQCRQPFQHQHLLSRSSPADRLDAVFPGRSVDRVAERVTRPPPHVEDNPAATSAMPPEYRCPAHHYCSFERPPLHLLSLQPRREMKRRGIDGLLRRRIGKFTVIGIAHYRAGKRDHLQRWVVQCACGRYEYRSTQALRNGLDMQCDRCGWNDDNKQSRPPLPPVPSAVDYWASRTLSAKSQSPVARYRFNPITKSEEKT
jgi:hypothetical protein